MAAVKKEDWQQVLAHMTVYVVRSPGDADAWNELGHAHRKLGDLGRAEQELKVLDGLCFFPCEEFTDLKAEIAKYRSQQRAQSGNATP